MRHLEFRVWDKENNRMLVEGLFVAFSSNKSEWEASIDNYWVNDRLGVLMQYTGLLDKHGKKIFEGDIVTHPSVYGLKDKSKVFYENGYFYPLVTVEIGYNSIDRYRPEDFEIIGNIYEHPELIEVKQ